MCVGNNPMKGADMGIKSFQTRLSQQREARVMKYISICAIISVFIAIKLTYSADRENDNQIFLKIEPENRVVPNADRINNRGPSEVVTPSSNREPSSYNASVIKESKVENTDVESKSRNQSNLGKEGKNGTKPLLDRKEALETLRERMKGRNVSTFTCETCMVLTKYMSELLQKGFTEKAIAEMSVEYCKWTDMFSENVCKLAIREWNETFFWILDHSLFQPADLCGLFSDSCGQPVYPPSTWNLTFSSKPRPTYKPMERPAPNSATLRVLFLTDIHMDPDYTTGAKVDCGDPLCCRAVDGTSVDSVSKGAPKWGALGLCDVPPRTLHSLFDQLQSNGEKFDLVMFTGDIAPHDVYNQTIDTQLYVYNLTYSLLMKYFPNTPVLSVLGNHESNPVDQFIPPNMGPGELQQHPMDWLYSAFVHNTRRWMPQSTATTMRKGGFWSWQVLPGLKVIGVNTNYGMHANWYMRITNQDVVDQVQWLIEELQHAEDQGLRVWILSHHPVPDVPEFKKWYHKVLQRYSGSIASMFYGHTHLDDLKVYLDSSLDNKPVLSGKIGAGVTGYHGDYRTNFGYQIVTTDGVRDKSTFGVLDIEARILNLTEASETGIPKWRKEYTMCEEYQLKSLFPEDYQSLIDRMKLNSTIVKQFYYRKYKSSRPFDACDATCVNSTLSTLTLYL